MTTLAKIFQWRVAWAAVLSMGGFALVAYFIPQKILMQFLNICTLSVASAIVITYAPAWTQTLKKRTLDGADALSLGIGCTWTSEIGQRIWSIVWRGLDQPAWMTNSLILPLLLTLNIIGGIQHITAPGAVDGMIPKKNWIVLGATFGFATFISLLVIWWQWGISSDPVRPH